MTAWKPVLLANVNRPNSERITTYLDHGGYEALRKALKMTPDAIIAEVKASGLRGRGGAGFPTGMKWGFMPKDAAANMPAVKYLAVNTDEGEPGTFKDRLIVERDPHCILEGVIIASYAIGAHRAFVYIRGEFFLGVKRWIKAISDAYQHGFLGKNILSSGFDLDVSVHRGAGAYICGEETAMIESLEGKRGEPRLKPPYPAQVGLWGQPTLVQNVETLANIPHIVQRGAAWFASIGTEQSKGPKVFCISGHVNRPGNYELPLGTPLREIIYEHAGGVRYGRNIKAVIPGGASTPILTPDKLDVPMAFETLVAAGSAWAPAPSWSWTKTPIWSRSLGASPASSSTNRAVVACPAASAANGCWNDWTVWRPTKALRRIWRSWTRYLTASPASPSAPWAPVCANR